MCATTKARFDKDHVIAGFISTTKTEKVGYIYIYFQLVRAGDHSVLTTMRASSLALRLDSTTSSSLILAML